MNRIQYIFLTALLILSGCEKNSLQDIEVGNTSNSYIFFDAAVMETKGLLLDDTGLPNADGTDFGVFGFRPSATDGQTYGDPLFTSSSGMRNVARVFRASDGAAFSYTNLEIWHPGEHDFYAFYPYDESIVTFAGMSILSGDQPYISYTQPQTLDGMFDLMTAKAENQTSSNPIVQLNFEHRLFAFDVVLINSQTNSKRAIEITESSIEFTGLNTQATMYFKDGDDADTELDYHATTPMESPLVHNYGAFTVLGVTDSTPVQYNMNEKVVSGTAVSNPFLFIPCSTLRVKLTLKIKTDWDETMVYTYDHSTPETALAPEGGFKAGHKYSIIVTKTEEGIDFKWEWENANGDWANGPDSSFDFN